MGEFALPFIVTLNLFQGPSGLPERTVQGAKWVLKQVQHDEFGGWERFR
jgi:hypothetical protein